MKKSFLLASCAAVILILNNVSFAADEVVVADAKEPCGCCYCNATAHAMPAPMPAPMPFAYPPAPQRVFGAKLHALLSNCPLKHRAPAGFPCDPFPCGPVPCDPCVAPAPMAMPCDPCVAPAFPCPEPRPFRAAFAARRAARLAQPPFPCPPAPMPAPMMEPAPMMPAPVAVPPVAVPPVAVAPAGMPAFAASVGQTGRMNYMSQRAPVINLLSVVRGPRAPYEPYPYAGAGFYQVPVAPQPMPVH